jgi:hypothetical protein
MEAMTVSGDHELKQALASAAAGDDVAFARIVAAPFTTGFPWSVDDDAIHPRVFVDEGAYEGLFIAADETFTGSGFDLRGFVFEGELPVVAEPWTPP